MINLEKIFNVRLTILWTVGAIGLNAQTTALQKVWKLEKLQVHMGLLQ